MQDLSHLAADSLAPTSQHGGNQIFGNNAMAAPGGESGDLPEQQIHPAPVIEMQPPQDPGTPAARQPREYTPSPASWKKVTG